MYIKVVFTLVPNTWVRTQDRFWARLGEGLIIPGLFLHKNSTQTVDWLHNSIRHFSACRFEESSAPASSVCCFSLFSLDTFKWNNWEFLAIVTVCFWRPSVLHMSKRRSISSAVHSSPVANITKLKEKWHNSSRQSRYKMNQSRGARSGSFPHT